MNNGKFTGKDATIAEMKEYAMINNDVILHAHIILYERGECDRIDVMQMAAVALSKRVIVLKAELLRIARTRVGCSLT